jgi:hypothetical protein
MEQITTRQLRQAVCDATGWDLSSTTGAKLRQLFKEAWNELHPRFWGTGSQVGDCCTLCALLAFALEQSRGRGPFPFWFKAAACPMLMQRHGCVSDASALAAQVTAPLHSEAT